MLHDNEKWKWGHFFSKLDVWINEIHKKNLEIKLRRNKKKFWLLWDKDEWECVCVCVCLCVFVCVCVKKGWFSSWAVIKMMDGKRYLSLLGYILHLSLYLSHFHPTSGLSYCSKVVPEYARSYREFHRFGQAKFAYGG